MPATQTNEIAAAQRLDNLRYAIRDLVATADEVKRQGHKVLYLNVGDPNIFDFAPPAHLIEAAYRAMRENKNGYAPSAGVPEALEAIRHQAEKSGMRSIQDVFITNGAGEAVDLSLTALLNPGDNVLTPRPDYPLYPAVLCKIGAEANPYYLNEEDGWQPELSDIKKRINSRTKAIVLINPNNPTGALCTRKMLEDLAELARQHNLLIIADEIYDKLILDGGEHISIAAVAPDVPVVTIGGLSKNYLAPGWRMGWAIVSGDPASVKPYIEGIHKMLRARLSANHPQQYAIKPALEGPQEHLVEVRRKLTARRDLTVETCNSIPRMSCVPPRGAFYAFPRIDVPEDDAAWVKQLLLEKHILTVQGSGFGQKPGTKHFRIVFLPQEETLRRAYSEIRDFMRGRG
jgi:alanine-synthesizing transaminase